MHIDLKELIRDSAKDKLTPQGCYELVLGRCRSELVRRCVHDVAKAARRRMFDNPALEARADDLLSAGTVAAVEAINLLMLKPSPGTNPLAFIRLRIKWALKGICGGELIRVNGDTVRRAHHSGKLSKVPCVMTGLYLDSRRVPNGDVQQAEFWEWILKRCCEDSRDRQVIKMRHEGHTVGQIAKRFLVSPQLITSTLNRIERAAVAAYKNNFEE